MDNEKRAIELIEMASEMSERYYKKPIVCTYSGGKDSDVLVELFLRSGVEFEVYNSHTTEMHRKRSTISGKNLSSWKKKA